MSPERRLFLGSLLFVAAGCATTSSMLAERFAKERGCYVDRVYVSEESSQEYEVEGCGQRTVYVCESSAGMNADEKRCHERGGADRSPPDDTYRNRPALEPPK
jgi:hypothetical protein